MPDQNRSQQPHGVVNIIDSMIGDDLREKKLTGLIID
jgi:hypothetical protein